MLFWLRNIVIALLLIGLAWAFFANQEYLLSLDGSLGTIEASATDDSTSSSAAKYQQATKDNNAAAEGLSNFYAKIYGSGLDEKGPKIRNNIIFLPDPQGDLVKTLQAREVVIRPYKKTWQGTTASRPFRTGETLYQKLAEYASEDGLEVIWWLNRDFVIKDPFRIEKDILKTAYQIGEAVAGHFHEGIASYFCYRQRTLVFINEAPDYLDEECIALKDKYDSY